MQEQNDLTKADAELADALGQLRPAPSRLDRDTLLFEAGRTAGRRGRAGWPCISGTLAVALCVTLAMPYFANQPVSPEPGPIATSANWLGSKDVSVDALAPPGQGEYLQLRDTVLEKGVDALPQPAISSSVFPPETWGRRYFHAARQQRVILPRIDLAKLFYQGDGT